MPTLEQIQKEYPNIKFTITNMDKFPDPVLTIEALGQYVDLSWIDIDELDMKTFNDRILNPCLSAIARKSHVNTKTI